MEVDTRSVTTAIRFARTDRESARLRKAQGHKLRFGFRRMRIGTMIRPKRVP